MTTKEDLEAIAKQWAALADGANPSPESTVSVPIKLVTGIQGVDAACAMGRGAAAGQSGVQAEAVALAGKGAVGKVVLTSGKKRRRDGPSMIPTFLKLEAEIKQNVRERFVSMRELHRAVLARLNINLPRSAAKEANGYTYDNFRSQLTKHFGTSALLAVLKKVGIVK
jgi:hypothetical protein